MVAGGGELVGPPRDVQMILSWVINLMVAEWVIRAFVLKQGSGRVALQQARGGTSPGERVA